MGKKSKQFPNVCLSRTCIAQGCYMERQGLSTQLRCAGEGIGNMLTRRHSQVVSHACEWLGMGVKRKNCKPRPAWRRGLQLHGCVAARAAAGCGFCGRSVRRLVASAGVLAVEGLSLDAHGAILAAGGGAAEGRHGDCLHLLGAAYAQCGAEGQRNVERVGAGYGGH